MNPLIPADRIPEPFLLRITEQRFNLRTDIRFTDPLIEEGHKDYRRDLFNENAIARLNSRHLVRATRCRCQPPSTRGAILKEKAGRWPADTLLRKSGADFGLFHCGKD